MALIKKPIKFTWGIILVLIGVLLLLQNFGLFSLYFVNYLSGYWSLGLILAGILMIFKQKSLGKIVLTISIVLGLLILITPNSVTSQTIIINKNIEYKPNLENVNYEISSGVGMLNIEKNNNDIDNKYLVITTLNTNLNEDIDLDFNKDNKNNNTKIISISKNIEENKWFDKIFNQNKIESELNISLNPIPSTLNLDYGATEANIDLRGLNVSYMNLDFGASKTTIYFENNIRVDVNTGVSELNLMFPKDKNILIESDSGAVDFNLEGFQKINNKYYNNYDAKSQDIIINIDAGLSSINGGFYDE